MEGRSQGYAIKIIFCDRVCIVEIELYLPHGDGGPTLPFRSIFSSGVFSLHC